MDITKIINFIAGDWKNELVPEEHDCPLIGGHGMEGCDNPAHERKLEKEAERELIESKNL